MGRRVESEVWGGGWRVRVVGRRVESEGWWRGGGE